MVAATRELPASGYALEIDGRLKAEFATKDGACAGAEEVKERFPMLQVRIYDALTKAREEVPLPVELALGAGPDKGRGRCRMRWSTARASRLPDFPRGSRMARSATA
jgi:hypothetical protein